MDGNLEKFNRTFMELVEDLIRRFPDDGDFRMYNIAIQGALLLNQNIVQSVFHDHVVKVYGDEIMAKNEHFFLTHDYKDVADGAQDADMIIEKLKNMWQQMSAEDKEVIWKYFRVLVLLDKKITGYSI